MSLIGPRPDYYPHAVVYCHDIPGYSNRHLVRPGITGLAQVRSGYAACARSIAAKVNDDLTYIEDASWKIELSVRSEEHTSELQSLMRNSYAVFCLKKKQEK